LHASCYLSHFKVFFLQESFSPQIANGKVQENVWMSGGSFFMQLPPEQVEVFIQQGS